MVMNIEKLYACMFLFASPFHEDPTRAQVVPPHSMTLTFEPTRAFLLLLCFSRSSPFSFVGPKRYTPSVLRRDLSDWPEDLAPHVVARLGTGERVPRSEEVEIRRFR